MTTATDKCPRCGHDDCTSVVTDGKLIEHADCLRRQNERLRKALESIRRCGVECSECRDEIDNALRPYEQVEVAAMSERLTPERIAELRRIAEAATPDPREVQECPDPKYMALVTIPNWGPEAPELAVCLTDVDARHIATFDPPTVLALLDEIERLRDVLNTIYLDSVRKVQEPVEDEICELCGGGPSVHHDGCLMAEVERVLGIEESSSDGECTCEYHRDVLRSAYGELVCADCNRPVGKFIRIPREIVRRLVAEGVSIDDQ